MLKPKIFRFQGTVRPAFVLTQHHIIFKLWYSSFKTVKRNKHFMSQRVLTGKLPPKKFRDETLELELDDVETPTISSMSITKVIDDQVRSFHQEQNQFVQIL